MGGRVGSARGDLLGRVRNERCGSRPANDQPNDLPDRLDDQANHVGGADVRPGAGDVLLHLLIEALAERENFHNYDLVRVNAGEEYAANCVRVNDRVLVAAGYPGFESTLQELGYETIAIEMTEFQKMDGGLSCLSLRF